MINVKILKCPKCGYEMTLFDDKPIVCEGCKKVINPKEFEPEGKLHGDDISIFNENVLDYRFW